ARFSASEMALSHTHLSCKLASYAMRSSCFNRDTSDMLNTLEKIPLFMKAGTLSALLRLFSNQNQRSVSEVTSVSLLAKLGTSRNIYVNHQPAKATYLFVD